MRVFRLGFLGSVTRLEHLFIVVPPLIACLAASFVVLNVFYESLYLALKPPSLFLKPLVFHKSLLSLLRPDADRVASTLVGVYIEGVCRSYWLHYLYVTVLASLMVYPLLSRIVFQLPSLLYRLGVTPVRVYVETLLLVFVATLPVTLAPVFSTLLIASSLGLAPYMSVGRLLKLLPYALAGIVAPLEVYSVYLASNRIDYSLVAGVGVVEATYLILNQGGLTQLLSAPLLAAPIAASYLIVSRWRWATWA